MQIGYCSDIGKKRAINEDNLLCIKFDMAPCVPARASALLLLADGMGGHNAGEVASKLAVTETGRACLCDFPSFFSAQDEQSTDDNNFIEVLEKAINAANKIIYETSKKDSNVSGMGTTIVAAAICGQDLYVTNVGDSRCYIINENEILQITTDHSLAHEMIVKGIISEEDSHANTKKNVLTRVVGYDEKTEPESHIRKMFKGDQILLCSDGLWGVITDEQIRNTIVKAGTPQIACDELVAMANNQGGPDNISVIIARPEHLPSKEEIMDSETRILTSVGSGARPALKKRKGFFPLFGRKKG